MPRLGTVPVAVSKGRQQALTKALTSSCRTSFSATSPATTRNYSVATRTCEWLARVSTAARTSTGTTRCGRTCRSRSRSASARRSSCSMRCSSRRRQKRAAARAPPRRRPWPPQRPPPIRVPPRRRPLAATPRRRPLAATAPRRLRVNTDGRRAHRIDPLATCHFVPPPCRLNRGARIGCFKYFKEKQSSYAQTRHIHSPSKQSQSGNETMVGSVAERWP